MRRLSLLLLVCFAGCNCQVPPPGVDGGADAGVDAGAVEFSLDPFAPVVRGESLDRTGTFTNTRADAVEVTGIVLSPGGDFQLVGPTTLTVPPGGTASLSVRFAPTGLGANSAQLHFSAPQPYSVNLRGLGIGPALGLEPTQLDLGTVPLYQGAPARASATLTLRNLGLDVMPSNPATALQAFFDVQSTSAAAASELCAGDCTGTPLSLAVDASTVVPLELSSPTPGMKTWDVRVFSNDPSAPMRTVAVTAEVVTRPTCQFSLPSTLAFGVLTQPERRDLEVIFENVGTEPCEVSRVDVGPETPAQSAPLFSVLNPLSAQTVAPGEVLRVLVRASPPAAVAAPVTVNAELRLQLNHPDGFARVALSANLEKTCLWVSPSPVDFGTVQTGCRSADRAITLTNVCARSLVLTSAAIPGFSWFSASTALPRTLAAGDTATLTARFTPFSAGLVREVIDLTWLDGSAVKHTFLPLVGEASNTGLAMERFSPAGAALDVLLVLDDSTSMAGLAPQLAAQLPRVLSELQSRAVDFHLGVVTATSSGGVLRSLAGGARWLTPSTPNLTTGFAELTAFTGTHENESCEAPALAALTPPLITDPASNGGFRRAGVGLTVLCITDRSDSAALLSRVLELPTRPRWDVVGPTGPGCGDFSPAQSGHVAYTDATGGELFGICNSDWTPLFVRFAGQTTGPRSVFPLRAPADPLGFFFVTVSGQATPATTSGGSLVWAWEEPLNLVRFVSNAAPPASAPVEISYPTICIP